MIKKVKNTVLWTYVIKYLNSEEIIGICYEKGWFFVSYNIIDNSKIMNIQKHLMEKYDIK